MRKGMKNVDKIAWLFEQAQDESNTFAARLDAIGQAEAIKNRSKKSWYWFEVRPSDFDYIGHQIASQYAEAIEHGYADCHGLTTYKGYQDAIAKEAKAEMLADDFEAANDGDEDAEYREALSALQPNVIREVSANIPDEWAEQANNLPRIGEARPAKTPWWRKLWSELRYGPAYNRLVKAQDAAQGNAGEAISFALQISDHWDMREFLESWHSGDWSAIKDEWPEYYEWLAKQRRH